MKYLTIFLFISLPVILTNCATSENIPGNRTQVEASGDDFSNYRNLADYLRRLPGVQVTGAGNNVNIQIRGVSSFGSETRPLYIIDGRIMGNSYSEVNRSLTMSEVSSIRILSDSDAGAYGVRGANGVIEITLKR